MRVLLNVDGVSQYAEKVKPAYRNSACGPTTAYVILNYLRRSHNTIAIQEINELYKRLGGTKIGLFTWRFIKNLRKELGLDFHIARCSLTDALDQLKKGHPVAMKFDQYFTFRWFTKNKPLYKYHWVPLIGYELKNEELYLLIHDNGGRTRDSQIRSVKYEDNKHVLRFVKIEPLHS